MSAKKEPVIIVCSVCGGSKAYRPSSACRYCNASKGAKTLQEWLPTRDYEVRRAVAQAMGIEVTES